MITASTSGMLKIGMAALKSLQFPHNYKALRRVYEAVALGSLSCKARAEGRLAAHRLAVIKRGGSLDISAVIAGQQAAEG